MDQNSSSQFFTWQEHGAFQSTVSAQSFREGSDLTEDNSSSAVGNYGSLDKIPIILLTYFTKDVLFPVMVLYFLRWKIMIWLLVDEIKIIGEYYYYSE